jgi:DNA polymerase III alpha subunit
MSDGPIASLGVYRSDRFSIAGVLTNAVMKFSKKDGKRRCELTLEDFTGRTTLLAFSDTVDALESATLLVPLRCLLVTGGYSKRDALADNPTFMIDSAVALSSLQTSPALGIEIRLRHGEAVAPELFAKVRELLESYPGPSQVQVAYEDDAGAVSRLSVRSGTVAATTELVAGLRAMLGKDRVRLVRQRIVPARRGPSASARRCMLPS